MRQSSRYKALIPMPFYSERIPTESKRDFLYIGRESLNYLRDYWEARAERMAMKGLASNEIYDRMELVSEAQMCRTRARLLENLASEAESKPSIFRELPTAPGSRVTCMLHGTNGAYANCVLMNASKDKDGELIYEVRVVDKRPRFRKFTGAVKFKPDLLSVIPTEDLPYLRCHPHFFNLYLMIAAEKLHKEKRVEKIVAAVG